MWEELQQAFMRMLMEHSSRSQTQPQLKSYSDTLGYLAGGMPTVVDQHMTKGTFGTYVPVQPSFGINADTIAIDNGQQVIPRDFTLAHEVGHKIYYTNEPLPSAAKPFGAPSPELQEIIKRLHSRAVQGGGYSNMNEGEPFAQAFAQGLQNVRGHPYTPPTDLGPANPKDVRSMQAWIQSKLDERNPGVLDWLKHFSGSLLKDSYWNKGSTK